jgi:hypothetical protein
MTNDHHERTRVRRFELDGAQDARLFRSYLGTLVIRAFESVPQTSDVDTAELVQKLVDLMTDQGHFLSSAARVGAHERDGMIYRPIDERRQYVSWDGRHLWALAMLDDGAPADEDPQIFWDEPTAVGTWEKLRRADVFGPTADTDGLS